MSGVVLLLGLTAFILGVLTPWYGAPVFAGSVILGALLAIGLHRSRRPKPSVSVLPDAQPNDDAKPIEPR